MQEEVTQGAVTLIINGAKISEQTLEKAIQKTAIAMTFQKV